MVAHGKGETLVTYKPVYTVQDAAKELHISKQTLYRLIHEGRIKVMRVYDGGDYAVSGEDLKEFIEKRRGVAV